MAGEFEENVAAATSSALTPPAGLTRRELREWERKNGVNPVVSARQDVPVQEPAVSATPQTHTPPISAPQAQPVGTPRSDQPLTRRELRLREQGLLTNSSQPGIDDASPVASAESHNVVVVPEISEEVKPAVAPVIVPELQPAALTESVSEETIPELEVEPVGNFVVPVAEPVVSVEPVEETEPEAIETPGGSEPLAPAASLTIAQTAALQNAARESTSEEQSVRPHKLVKRTMPRRPAFLSNRSQRDRSAADRRRQISQRVFSVLALFACFAFALSISIPANALLTQSDVAKIKMQAFLDEQVSLASQSVDVDADSTTATASRDGVDVTLAAKAAPIQFYGNSGLCGEETSVNPPSSGGAITWPLTNRKVSSGYGYRWGSLHAGIDFEGETGTPIYSVADGIVKAAQPSPNNSLGVCVIIAHNVNGVQFDTLYGHLSRLDVGVGQGVGAGQVIGAVGSTGNSTGSHLHFEVHVNGVQIDPAPFMSNYAG
ncbi:hypothetical protein AINA4_13790 [Aurantimicrobium sp. INA4]|uniref:peptidoglycan DD-metalloendopeptidase family protein n=1 Tax=Aurantimicrobium sp. INA4 TaxID=2986279 RepID=UPI0024920BCA|nr:peptidoglycan DD-metalloendopeptidase family protein [Aurantimicrobium sp. INA4]BDU11458.1 hypothetical protein AINA4_13790 [Aurantimicrobium sp. INA4]